MKVRENLFSARTIIGGSHYRTLPGHHDHDLNLQRTCGQPLLTEDVQVEATARPR